MGKKHMMSKRLKKELEEFYKETSGSWTTKGMSKCQLAITLSAICNRKMSDMVRILESLEEIAIEELKNKGHFTIPGIVKIEAKGVNHGVKAFAI